MKLLDAFNKKKYLNRVEFEIVISQLQLLAECMENGTDKPTDLKYWTQLIDKLNSFENSNIDFYDNIRNAYYTLFKLYRMKHYPEMVGYDASP